MVQVTSEDLEKQCDHLIQELQDQALAPFGGRHWRELSEEEMSLLDADIRWQAVKRISVMQTALERISESSDLDYCNRTGKEGLVMMEHGEMVIANVILAK